jgi:hypothetical protein
MAGPARRDEAREAEATPEKTEQVLEARHETMQHRYEAVMTSLCAMETKVEEVVNACGSRRAAF